MGYYYYIIFYSWKFHIIKFKTRKETTDYYNSIDDCICMIQYIYDDMEEIDKQILFLEKKMMKARHEMLKNCIENAIGYLKNNRIEILTRSIKYIARKNRDNISNMKIIL